MNDKRNVKKIEQYAEPQSHRANKMSQTMAHQNQSKNWFCLLLDIEFSSYFDIDYLSDFPVVWERII